ncbi:myelin-oligodendrocyte glycoprotein-like [Solea solea]|uniref:myelin-oligodendrocyte glycoprotein-like n=1 Tax=Solea solea TaxID=90069 RepID=UPI00272AB518|nr:myelin-oligodendrocyte glycoprotein-like [Solea solea]
MRQTSVLALQRGRTYPGAEQYHVSCPTQTIEVKEGDDVKLWCQLDPTVDLKEYTVDFTRPDHMKMVVHVYRHGSDHPFLQSELYRNRTRLVHQNLREGRITMWISSVQLTDTGPYKCSVQNLKANCTIRINVVEQKDAFTTVGPVTSKDPGKCGETIQGQHGQIVWDRESNNVNLDGVL